MTRPNPQFRTNVFVLVMASLGATAASAGNWNEDVNGDLSGDYQNPTGIALSAGVNTIRATSGSTTTTDIDYFRLDLPAQGQIDAIILRGFESQFDSTAFIGVQEGTSFTFPANEAFIKSAELLGWAHFGLFEGDGVGGDILPQMGMAFGAIGFSGPLTAPSYTFWAQQQGDPITYELEFVVSAVPEPSSLVAAVAAVFCSAWRRRL